MPNIVEYSARWYVVKNKGVIKVKDQDGNTTELEFKEPGEFTAILTILNSPGDARMSDIGGERVISSGLCKDEVGTSPSTTGAFRAAAPNGGAQSRAEQIRRRITGLRKSYTEPGS
ncbi:MAG: hypothetical protein D6776_08925 [Planctomycetota bacterium]|nr:MAG: hypothetical protein D6776_08925 [Planctomycetota bacterium]